MSAPSFPPPGQWPTAAPGDLGLHPEQLAEAVRFAGSIETRWPVDLSRGMGADPREKDEGQWGEIIGPTRDRGGPNGMIVRNGRVAAAWGDTGRADMTFSVTKSYLAVLAGVALAEGAIASIDDRAGDYALDDGFDSPHNAPITWRHLLQQTSEWEGTLWGKPDLVDRNRRVGVGVDNSRKGTHRDLQAPGTFYEYNDVRVNRLSLSLLQAMRRPLPDVLASAIMAPIGASDTWHWHPYRNSWVTIDGRRMPSVPGGGHWGGGLFISSEDHARLGLLVARGGEWQGRRLLPEGWVDEMTTPCPVNPVYGLLWWLNTDGALYPSGPRSSFFAHGAGRHVIWVDRSLDLVAVFRWIDAARADELVGLVMRSLE